MNTRHTAPSTRPLSKAALTEQVQALLSAPQTEIAEHDNLIERGLDSLSVMRLASVWRKLGAAVSFAHLMETPSVAAWWALMGEPQADRARIEPLPLLTGFDPRAPFALTDVQHAYWIGRQDQQALGGVGCHAYLELTGPTLEPKRLENAWHRLRCTHGMLRAHFDEEGQQRIAAQAPRLALPVHDLRKLDEPATTAALTQVRERLSHRRLNIADGQVMGLELSLLGSGRSCLHVDIDLLVADVQSLNIVLRDLARCYATDADSDTIEPSPTSWHFGEYLAQEHSLRSQTRSQAQAYWQARLDSLPGGPELPLAVAPQTLEQTRFTRRTHTLPMPVWQALRQRAAEQQITPAVLLLSAYAEVLARWSSQSRFLINIPLFDRQIEHPGIDDAIADFTSLVLLECDCRTPQTFSQRARQLQSQLHADVAHGSYSGVSVLRDLARARPDEQLAAPVVFACNLGTPLVGSECRAHLGELSYMISQTPQVWLDHQVYETGDGLLLAWDAVEALFPEALLDDMFSAYTHLLNGLASDTEAWQNAAVELLPERQALVRAQANATGQSRRLRPLHADVFTQSLHAPERTALIDEAGTLSFAELSQRALAVAACLIESGVQPQMPVAVSLPRGRQQVIAVLGVLAAGACYVPIGIKQPASRRAKINRTAGIRHVLCSAEHWPELLADDQVTLIPVEQAQDFTPLAKPLDVDPAGPAYVIFTSGSTGEPKGVQIAHHAAANTIDDLNSRYGIDPSSRGLAVSALDFDLSVYDVFGLLGAGGSLVLISEEQQRDASSWLTLIQAHQVNLWNSVPVLLDMLMVVARHEQAVLPLRKVMLSGDWIGLDLPARLQRSTNGHAQMIAMGGATEASIWSNVFDVPAELPAHWTSIPYGKPLGNQQYRVADDQGRDCPDWVAGELWIGGVGVADGYRGAPELTAQRFVEHNGQRWYRTGDRGRYWPDGNLEFLGRLDHQVKVRGHRIELGEIETALAALPGVDHAIAVTLGSPLTLAAALVVPCLPEHEAAWIAEVKLQLSARLPDYMVPSCLSLLSALPLSANGKVDRKQVLQSLQAQATQVTVRHEPPQGERERQVAEVWQQILQREAISRQQSFFALGGDSLLATQVITQLKRLGWGTTHGLRVLFAQPRLADFAAQLQPIQSGESVARVLAEPAQRHAPFPLTEVQRAYWMGQSSGLPLNCGTRYLVELDGQDVDLSRIERAWNRLLLQHDMLRAVIDEEGQQRILPQVPAASIQMQQLGAADAEQLAAQVNHVWQQASCQAAPMHSLHAFLYGDRHCRLAIIFNYMTLDGFSIKRVLEQLAQLYADPQATTEAPGLTFRDYVNQVRPSEDAVKRAEEYWRARLHDLPGAAALPLACDPQSLSTVQFHRRQVVLPAANWQALCNRARQHDITPSVLLLTAYAQTLSRWSGGTAHTLNLTLFDRQEVHPDIHQVLGDFTSLAPVAFHPQKDAGLLTHARALQQGIVDALEHREVSSIWIQRERSRTCDRASAALPIVFTSTLGLGGGLFERPAPGFPDMVAAGMSETPQVWLDHQVYEYNGALVLTWDAVDALFPAGLLDDMFGAYQELLAQLQHATWEQPLNMALPQTQRQMRQRVNASEDPRRLRTLHADAFAQAVAYPQRPALIDEAGVMSFGELRQAALAVAACLIEAGVQPQMPVAISLPRGRQQVIAVLGVLAAGACYVPIGIKQPASRRAKIHRTAGIRHVLCSIEQRPELEAGDAVALIPLEQALTFTPLPATVDVPHTAAAYVIFTSGSTGEPKGVQIAHHAAANTIDDLNSRYGIDQSSRGLAVSALDFDLSVYDLFGLLGAGGSLVLLNEEQQRDAASWLELIQTHQVNLWNSVPVLLDMLLVVARHEQATLPLRQAMLSGDWIGLDLPARLQQCTNGRARMIAMGGATEASIWSNVFDVPAQLPAHWTSIPYGKPLSNQQYRVVDELGRDCPNWVAGELWIGGVGVADGYRGAPELTAQRFVAHNGKRWYRTGDRGRYWPDGNLEFLGRLDHQVKVRGHRIELGEIETALTALPGVDHAIAVTTGSPASLAAALVVERRPVDERTYLRQLTQQLSAALPDYMVPSVLVLLDELPLSANGKVDRKQVLTSLAQQAQPANDAFEAPQDARERQVAAVWEEVLQQPRVGRRDSFFALGGDSLSGTQVIARLKQSGLGSEQGLRQLFANPQLADFAARLDTRTLSDTPRRLTANVEGRHAPFPLTEVQRAYWMGQHGDLPLSCGSHYLLELDGEQVDLPRLEQAWNQLVQRHDMLRVVFDADRTQRVLAQVPPVRIETDSHAATDLEQARARLHQAWHGQPVKLGHWPLFTLRAVPYGQARCRLGIFLNYMALDGYSIKLLLNELATLFGQLTAALPDIGIGFRDYVEQVRPDPLALRRAQAWWQAKLEHLPAAAALPLACDPQTLTHVQFNRRSGRLNQATWQPLRSLARQNGITPSVLVLVAYAQVLSQWSGGTAHTLNMTLFDRQDVHPDIHRVLGDFTSLAPVAYDPQNGASLLQQAQAMQQEIADALDHREVSSIWVQRERARRLGSSGAALPVVFTSTLGISDSLFDQALPDGFPDLADGGLSQTPQVWLDHQMYEHHGELLFSWDVVEALFPEGLIDSMFSAFVAQLEGLAEQDWSAPASLTLPPRHLEARLNANATERPRRSRGLHADVFARALHAPERTALIDEAGTLSFAELSQRALAVAACLIESGVQPQMPVAVSLPRGRQQVIAVLGVLAAGACYVPIGIKQPASRRAKIHRTAGIRHVLCSAEHWPELLADDQVTLIPVEQAQDFTPLAQPLDVDPTGPAYVIFTSGSTGEPKGVQIAHHAAANTIDDLNSRYGIDPSSRGLAVSALDFDLSVYDVFGLLGAGGSLVLISEEQQRDAASWLTLIQAHQVNLWNSVPVLLDMLLVVARHEQAVLPLRKVMLSGDWIGLDLPARLQRSTNGHAQMIAMGGATEASIWSNVFDVPAELPAHWTSIPYGKPLGNQQYRVADDQGRDCPDWVAGELWIGGVGVADGYRGAPELTAQRFVEHNGQRWYRTGDRGRYWPDGNLEFLGRLDHQVKVRGHRIELGEIETALAALPGVDHAIAVTLGSPAALAAALVMAVAPADPAPCIDAFKQRLSKVLPDYMVPTQLLLLAQLPLSANGKVDRATVLAQLVDSHQQANGYQAPLAGLESEIAAVWRAVLQRPAVSRHDDFFALGGDSLSATRIVTLLQERLGTQAVTLRTLYAQAPTVAALAAHIQACGRSHPLRPAHVEQALYEEGIL